MRISAADQKKAAELLCGIGFLSVKAYPNTLVVIAKSGKKFNFGIDQVKSVLKSSKQRKTRKKTSNITDTAQETKSRTHQDASKQKKTT